MPKQHCKHPMLKQCSSINARRLAEQCSTNAPNELTHIFGLLEHLSHVSFPAQGGQKK